MAKNRDADTSRAKARNWRKPQHELFRAERQIGQSSIDLPYMRPRASDFKIFQPTSKQELFDAAQHIVIYRANASLGRYRKAGHYAT